MFVYSMMLIVAVLSPAMELLDNVVVLSLISFFLRFLHTIFHSGCTNLLSQQQWTRVPFSPHLCQHLLSLIFLMMAIPTGLRGYPTVVLVCISLMTSEVEHFLMHPLAFYMSSFRKCLFKSLSHSLIGLWTFCY